MPSVITRDLVELVILDHLANGKRSTRAVRAHKKHLCRLMPQLPDEVDIERYKIRRLEERAAPGTVRNELSTLSRGFKLALRRKLVRSVPLIERMHVDNVRTVCCTSEQIRAVIAHLRVLDTDVADLITWLASTGWRRGQSCALTWSHATPDRSAVFVPQSATKGRRPHRVELGQEMRALLDRRWARRAGEFIFHRFNGRQIGRFAGPWRRATQEAGCPELRPHDQRRFWAQTATDLGIPVTVQMSTAGWRTAHIHARYAIVRGDRQAAATDAVAQSFI